MASVSAYDEIADWYETHFLAAQAEGDPLGVVAALRALLGTGQDRACLEIACGTGARARIVRGLGWRPVGADLSAGMLRWASERLPVVRADAANLPFPDAAFPAVVSVMAHTDMPTYPSVVREAARVLAPGGRFVHIGVHPCFCGGFADRADPDAIIIRPGYTTGHWTKETWTDQGVRAKVGAAHWPLPELLATFVDAGLVLERFVEGGEPTPVTLSALCRKPANAR